MSKPDNIIPLEVTFQTGYFDMKTEDGMRFFLHGVDKKKLLAYLPQIINLEEIQEAYKTLNEEDLL